MSNDQNGPVPAAKEYDDSTSNQGSCVYVDIIIEKEQWNWKKCTELAKFDNEELFISLLFIVLQGGKSSLLFAVSC